jgi:hypothetical protein
MHISGFASLHRLRRRAIREADFDIYDAVDKGNVTPDLGGIGDDYSMVIGIFPGFGSYWECQIVLSGESQEMRSYRLASLIEEVIKVLRAYERTYG